MFSFTQRSVRRKEASSGLVLAIVSIGFSLAALDLFVVNVALPKIAQDFGSSGLGNLSWVLNAYAIVYASLLVVFGRLADRFSRERAFNLGVGIFTLASALCATANSTLVLVIFRILQAVGAALMTPTSLGMVLATSSESERDNNVMIWTAIGGLMAALGPVVGGLLVELSWRWVFLVNVPFGLAVLAAGWLGLPHVPGAKIPYPDALGAILVTGGAALLSLGLVKGHDWGWGSLATVAVLAGSIVVIGLFVLHCLHHKNPMIDTALFKSRAFSGASVVATLFSVAFGAMLLSLVLWDQNVWHWSALHTGLTIAPGPLLVLPTALIVADPLIAGVGNGVTIAIGSIMFAIGLGSFAFTAGTHPNYFGEFLPGLVVAGIGVGLRLPTLMAAATSDLPEENFATGSAVVNMLRQVGLAVGVAVFIAVLGTPVGADALKHGFDHAWLTTAAFSALGAIASIVILGIRHPQPTVTSQTAGHVTTPA